MNDTDNTPDTGGHFSAADGGLRGIAETQNADAAENETMDSKVQNRAIERGIAQNSGADRSNMKKVAIYSGGAAGVLLLVIGLIAFGGSPADNPPEAAPPLPDNMVKNRNQKNFEADKTDISAQIAQMEAEEERRRQQEEQMQEDIPPPLPVQAARPADNNSNGSTAAEPEEDPRLLGSVLVGYDKPAAAAASAAADSADRDGAAVRVGTRSRAYMRAPADFLLGKGTNIPCTLDTKIVTGYPAMTRCLINRDVYSANGKTLLLERGSVVTGSQTGAQERGKARVFIVWNEIETPNGVRVEMDAPSSDSLGAAGQPAHIDSHFWERFGGAIMLSLIGDFSDALSNRISRSRTDTEIRFDNTSDAVEDMAAEALKNTINIPPTGIVHQGARLNIMVVKDVDFSGVYETVRLPPHY